MKNLGSTMEEVMIDAPDSIGEWLKTIPAVEEMFEEEIEWLLVESVADLNDGELGEYLNEEGDDLPAFDVAEWVPGGEFVQLCYGSGPVWFVPKHLASDPRVVAAMENTAEWIAQMSTTGNVSSRVPVFPEGKTE